MDLLTISYFNFNGGVHPRFILRVICFLLMHGLCVVRRSAVRRYIVVTVKVKE
jgi:hypothetical protein